jgi:hypothetical protein
VFGNTGQVLTDRMVSWSSEDTSVARVAALSGGTESARVFVTRTGTTAITASSEGRSASITLTSIDNIHNSSALEILDISLIEFELGGHWFYAPQLRVREPAGSTGVSVFGVSFIIPGIGATACLTHALVASGQATDLFHEVYGDFDVTFDRPGARATSPQASGIILVRDANGRVGHITVSVPIEPGNLPSTYSGLNPLNEWACTTFTFNGARAENSPSALRVPVP